MDTMNRLPETGFLRLPQIIGDSKRGIPPLIPISKSTWWVGCRTGRFPKPIRLSSKCTVWRVEDIRALIEQS
jgi:predicted DNA-binding transcriptional regulator AlpA